MICKYTSLGVIGRKLDNLLVEKVAEANVGKAEDTGAQGETFSS